MHLQNIKLKHVPPIETHVLHAEIKKIPFDNREVLIIIDDFTRPITPITRMVVEYAISEVGEDKVAVVVANGLHRASSQKEIGDKLGPDLPKRLRLYQHSPLCNFPLLNKKTHNIIAVGCVMPHTFTGMSGDAKIILPGLSYYENVMAFHGSDRKTSSDTLCSYKEHVDTYVNYTINSYGDPARLIVYKAGIDVGRFRCDAWNDYTVILPDPTDVAVLIPWFKNIDFQQSMNALKVCMEHRIVREGGMLCIRSDTPEGMGVHYGFQQPNGIKPAYYDEVFEEQFKNMEIFFVCPNIPENAIQEYFRRTIYNFPTMADFSVFAESRLGTTMSIALYHAADLMIGDRE